MADRAELTEAAPPGAEAAIGDRAVVHIILDLMKTLTSVAA